MKRHPILRSWPWTIALAAPLLGFLLLGLLAASIRASTLGRIFAVVVVAASLFALYRVLTSGVHILPAGLMVRELTRTTPIPWERVRSIETATTGRRGVYAPVVVVALAGARQQARREKEDRLELTILAAYREDVAKRRTAALVAARTAAVGRTKRRS